MPKYEYACKSCGERLEVVQKFTDDPLTECPACGGVLRKVFSAPAITFKGSGFYKTDNRTGRAKAEPKTDGKADKADKAETGSTPAKAESTSTAEAKPAAKAAEAKTA